MPPSGAAIPRRSRRKKLLGRAKSCRWQVFVRRRPPKQGELRTDVSKATMWGETRAAKGFNFVSAKPPLRRADSRFVEPRNSRQGSTDCHFLHCAKSNIKSTRDSVLRPRFKALPEIVLEKLPATRAEPGFSHKTAAKRL